MKFIMILPLFICGNAYGEMYSDDRIEIQNTIFYVKKIRDKSFSTIYCSYKDNKLERIKWNKRLKANKVSLINCNSKEINNCIKHKDCQYDKYIEFLEQYYDN